MTARPLAVTLRDGTVQIVDTSRAPQRDLARPIVGKRVMVEMVYGGKHLGRIVDVNETHLLLDNGLITRAYVAIVTEWPEQ